MFTITKLWQILEASARFHLLYHCEIANKLYPSRPLCLANFSIPISLIYQGPVVHSVFSLTSSLVVKMSTVLVSTISDTQICLLKNVSSFCKSHFCFSKNISPYKYDQSFNDTITNDIVSFEHLGPEFHFELFFSTAECSSSKHFSIMFSA